LSFLIPSTARILLQSRLPVSFEIRLQVYCHGVHDILLFCNAMHSCPHHSGPPPSRAHHTSCTHPYHPRRGFLSTSTQLLIMWPDTIASPVYRFVFFNVPCTYCTPKRWMMPGGGCPVEDARADRNTRPGSASSMRATLLSPLCAHMTCISHAALRRRLGPRRSSSCCHHAPISSDPFFDFFARDNSPAAAVSLMYRSLGPILPELGENPLF
jgi:hypothetical protein